MSNRYVNFWDKMEGAVQAKKLARKRMYDPQPTITDEKLNEIDSVGLKQARNRIISYNHRNRSTFFKPEFDFEEIQIAENVDSILFRAIHKKTNRLISAGWEFVGANDETVEYIKRRIAEIERVSNQPFGILIAQTARDLLRFSNAFWVKVRNADASSGKPVKDYRGVDVDPVAGYFMLPAETLWWKTKENGDLLYLEQRMRDGEKKQFHATDIVHFYANRNPGWAVGTPEIYPALDDISLLRHLEENVSELIDSALFPFIHYKIGTDEMPEKTNAKGMKESDVVKKKLEYMPAGAIWVSDHRHEIMSIGAEGRSLRIEPYLAYFKTRVMTAVGISPVDLGEGGDANRSTASTMTKSTTMDVEALQVLMRTFLEFYIIDDLLIEGGYDITDQNNKVKIRFGTVDVDQRTLVENQVIQKFINNLIDVDEARKELGLQNFTDEQLERTFSSMFAQPDAMAKSMGPGSVAAETLAEVPNSPVTKQAVEKEKTFTKQLTKMGKAQTGAKSGGRPKSKSGGASTSKSRPSNQHGTRSTPKTSKDVAIFFEEGKQDVFAFIDLPDADISDADLKQWIALVNNRYVAMRSAGISYQTLADSLVYRLGVK